MTGLPAPDSSCTEENRAEETGWDFSDRENTSQLGKGPKEKEGEE